MNNYQNNFSNNFTNNGSNLIDQINLNTEGNNFQMGNQNNFQLGNMGNQNNFQQGFQSGSQNNLYTEGFGNLGNNIDNISLASNNLNGTTLNDLGGINKHEDNNSLIKSLTKEIISNLKENNIELYDNVSKKSVNDNDFTDDSDESYKKKKKKKNKEKSIKEDVQEYVEKSNPLPSTNNYIPWIFDDCFNYKDFLVLFILYFILSQEMIKDFFAKYFTSLNPDDEGKVGIQGVIIYGLILTVLFMVIRKLF